MMSKYFISAPAKINLFLHIVGKAPCGYHLIESVFAFVELYDVLEFDIGSRNRGIRFLKPSCINRRDNTIQRAIGHLVRRCSPGTTDNVYVKVLKNIPVSSGLAGGSADAAAAINLLSKLWGINEKETERVAFRVGSDVPVCLESKTAFVAGMGDVVELLEDSFLPRHVILVGPKVELSTKSVFDMYNPKAFSPSIGKLPGNSEDWLSLLKEARNDLTEVSVELVPEIRIILDVLGSLDGCCFSRMSGSGAMSFAIFEDENSAELATRYLRRNYPDWFIFKTRIIRSSDQEDNNMGNL
ncbi:4-(cytidine 5'-diphospho)-2-C-methyl-D-erythritol kinase [Anaplasma phagocytophilum str. NCH-1]|nr:4-(cytidine 5'-diphospho)-2-C-methyl-D-erythritol kinase [Anaplasma phagocytophilum]KJV65203.1 4-(cytidine 5'-diphospho)-2-C-methyl-D-erythritol kinase [Anaplasma phagocytophilum str. NCH-1]